MGRHRTYQPQQILVALERYRVQHGRPPTIEEFRKTLGVGSTRTVLRYLQELEDGKFIRRHPGSRGIEGLRRPSGGPETRPVPVPGPGTAGAPAACPRPAARLRPPLGRAALCRLAPASSGGSVAKVRDLLPPARSRA